MAMGFKSPCMDHVKKAHVFKTQELPVTSVGEFVIKDQAHGAELANEDRPVTHGGKGEASSIGVVGHKGGSGADA